MPEPIKPKKSIINLDNYNAYRSKINLLKNKTQQSNFINRTSESGLKGWKTPIAPILVAAVAKAVQTYFNSNTEKVEVVDGV